jgi:hypothetical protein
LERLIDEREATASATGAGALPQLPILHLGAMGALHRRDIYDDGLLQPTGRWAEVGH